jgi:CDP-paratose 2-epimerase
MKILITGGCGFIGSNLAEEALKKNHDLYVIDNLSRAGSEINLAWLSNEGKFTFFNEDIRNFQKINDIVKKTIPDVIFHMAGQVAMTKSIENPLLDFQVNVQGTINILESVRINCLNPIIVYSSTNKVYGNFDDLNFIEEDTRYVCKDFPNGFDTSMPLNFQSPYGCSKGAADQYLLDYSRIFNLNTLVFRHSSMYGDRQFSTIDQGWIGWFIQKALDIKNEKSSNAINVCGTGKQVRDVLHSKDVVSLYYSSVYDFKKLKGKVFNIGGGCKNSLSIIELLKYLENYLSIKIKLNLLDARENDQLIFIADNTIISSLIEWEPKVGFNEGIPNFIQWIQNEKQN